MDVAGLSLITGALFALTYALIKANDYGWGSPTIVALLATAAAGLVAFVAVERRAPAPMIDLSMFRSREFTVANVIVMVANLATFGVLLYTSLYLQDVVHESPVAAGAALLPWVLMIIVLAPLGGRLADASRPTCWSPRAWRSWASPCSSSRASASTAPSSSACRRSPSAASAAP